MELVYLWVEKYKNIEKQGFNFSPKFRCKYNSENNELKIEENKNYVNIFPQNINITAVVGKNGSGKSSLLELISDYENLNNNFLVFRLSHQWYIFSKNKLNVNKSNVSFIGKNFKNFYLKNLKLTHLDYSQFINPFTEEKVETSIDILPEEELQGFESEKHKLFFKIYKSFNLLLIFNWDLFKKIVNLNLIRYPMIKYIKIRFNENFDFPFSKLSVKDTLYSIIGFYGEEYDNEKIINYKKTLDNSKKKIIDDFSEILNNKEVEINDYIRNLIIKFFDIIIVKDIELVNYFEIYLLGENKKTIIFSNGEKVFFNYCLSLGNKILLIDEIDLYLHLKILKNIINIFIDFASAFNIHIIFTTHSPFIISDLPKENIIFLNKDENGKCIVVDGLNEKKETFGANIHTLLSDSFFMEDGLIGEFAKSKIDEVIKYLNNEDSKIKNDGEAQRIINIIGEPIIKKELQRMLDSKRLTKVDKIKEIEEEIELLKHRLEVLRNNF